MLNLKNVINNLPSAVIVVDSDRRVLLTNKAAQAFSGQDETGLIGKRGGEIIGCVHAKESSQGCGFSEPCKFCEAKNAVVKAFLEKKDITPFETLIETAQSGPMYFKFTVTYLDYQRVRVSREIQPAAVVTVDDMTEYKKRERLEAVLETVGTICHEVNQPLMVLMGRLELMELQLGENRHIEVFKEQVDRINVIIRKLQTVKGYVTKPYLADNRRILDLEKAVKSIENGDRTQSVMNTV